MTAFLEMRGISKTFAGINALSGVDLDVHLGEVHAVAGANGAGKSTLMKIMTGVFRVDPGGTIAIDGVLTVITDPLHARNLGISIIYQELSMVENLTVAENIYLAREPLGRSGLIDKRKMNRDATALLKSLHLKVPATAPVATLSVGQKQMIEIGKAISCAAKIIIMDEPTASLSHRESQTLFEFVAKLRESGIGIVYISHRLEEIFEIANRVTVLRDGQTVDSLPIAEVTREDLVRKMVKRDLKDLYGQHFSHLTDEVVLSVRDLRMKHPDALRARVENISFDLHKGEVLGFFGLIGAGRTEIMEMIFGVRAYEGDIFVHGKLQKIESPTRAIDCGIGFVTEDRKAQGLVLGMTVRENFSMTHLGDYSQLEFINRSQEVSACKGYIQSLGIKTHSTEQQVENLSGGNQQKVIIAKWVARQPRILIVDEPTRGIDVGAKAEVHALLTRLVSEGFAIIVISSDLQEVLAVSDEVVVVKDGHIACQLNRAAATQDRVMRAAVG